MRPTLFFYCQHSVGVGHLVRSLTLAQAVSPAFRVVFLNGGPIPPGLAVPVGIEIIDLPPIGSDDGHALVSRDAVLDLRSAQQLRRERLLATYSACRPDVLLIELFPFGRKQFAGEILPLLKAARRAAVRPIVVSSVRDLLVNSRPNQQHHDDRAAWLAARYFDAVLVHSDPRVARIEDTFRPRRPLGIPLHYTGFVAPPSVSHEHAPPRAAHALVSAGGGLVGMPLFRAALAAQGLIAPGVRPRMRVVAGPFLPEPDWRELGRLAQGRHDVELLHSVPQLAAEMRCARISISQCGYNTAMDILSTRVPALVVPYGAGAEDEQRNRARRLAALGLLRLLESGETTPERFAAEIGRTMAFRPRAEALDLAGAVATAALLDSLLRAHRRGIREPLSGEISRRAHPGSALAGEAI